MRVGRVRAQSEIDAKTNEISRGSPSPSRTWAHEGKGRGRREKRAIRTAPSADIDWPYAAQVLRIGHDIGSPTAPGAQGNRLRHHQSAPGPGRSPPPRRLT